MTYRIRNWDKHYENCETKRFKHLRWVPVPNQHDGKYWRRLWTLDRAAEIFAAFILMVELASKMPERGVLADEDGELSTGDMALKTGAPEDIFVYAIPILCDLKWLEPAADLRQTCRTNRIEQNRIEQNNNIRHDNPASAGLEKPTLVALIKLNLPPATHKEALGLLKAAPRLSAFPLEKEGYAEACLDIIRGMLDLHQKHGGAVNLLKALNYYLKDAASPLLICAAVRRLNAMPEAPKSWYAYWRAIMGNPDVLRREWEENIWPAIKNGGVKWRA